MRVRRVAHAFSIAFSIVHPIPCHSVIHTLPRSPAARKQHSWPIPQCKTWRLRSGAKRIPREPPRRRTDKAYRTVLAWTARGRSAGCCMRELPFVKFKNPVVIYLRHRLTKHNAHACNVQVSLQPVSTINLLVWILFMYVTTSQYPPSGLSPRAIWL